MFYPRLEWRPRIEKRGLLSWWSDFGVQRFERSSDGRLESQSVALSPLGFATESGEFLWFGPRWTKEQLFEPFEIASDIVVPVGLYENQGYAGGFSTSGKRAFWYDNLTFRGGFFDGDWLTTQNSATFRLSRRLRLPGPKASKVGHSAAGGAGITPGSMDLCRHGSPSLGTLASARIRREASDFGMVLPLARRSPRRRGAGCYDERLFPTRIKHDADHAPIRFFART